MVNIKRYQEIDKQLKKVWSKSPTFLKYIYPINKKGEMKKFFENDYIVEPDFKYVDIRHDPLKIIDLLKKIKVNTDDILTSVYKKTIQSEINGQNILLNRGNREKVLYYSNKVFGKLTDINFKKVEQDLKNFSKEYTKDIEEKNMKSKDIKHFFEKKLLSASVRGWEVKIQKVRGAITIDGRQHLVLIPKDRKSNLKRLNALYYHEIEGHVFRYENGSSQKLRIFRGFPRSTATEEGIAMHLEYLNSDVRKKSYSKELLAYVVGCIYKGYSFRKTYNKLIAFGVEKERAFSRCLRVYRGGGFTKDFAYYQGYQTVKDFIQKGGDIKELYYGKYSIEDLPIVRKLKNEGVIVEPKYLPSICKTELKTSSPIKSI